MNTYTWKKKLKLKLNSKKYLLKTDSAQCPVRITHSTSELSF